MGNMGQTLAGLGRALGGPQLYNQQGVPPNGTPMDAMLNPGQRMFGMESPIPQPGESSLGNVDPRVIIDESGAMGNQDVTVKGDGWNPRKPTILGAIADAFLMSTGGKPMFSMMRDRRNINEAMTGYVDDPIQAMKRLSQIPGQEENVVKMMNQYRDDQRADLATESLTESRQAKYLDVLGSMANRILDANDPAAAFKNTRSAMQGLIDKYNLGDIVQLPAEYDEGAVSSLVTGKASEDAIKRKYLEQHRRATRDLNERKFESQDNYRQERLEDFDIQERGRNNRAAVSEAGKNSRSKSAPGQASSPMVRDNQGNVVGVVSKSGRVAKIAAPDGGTQYFEVLPNGRLGKRIPDALVPKEK